MAEVYGTKAMGAIYTTISISVAIGAYVMGHVLAGDVYDAHSSSTRNADGTVVSSCEGRKCFGLSYTVGAVTCAVAFLLMCQVGRNSRPRYARWRDFE